VRIVSRRRFAILPVHSRGCWRAASALVLVIASILGTARSVIAAGSAVLGPNAIVLSTGEQIRLFDIAMPAAAGCSCARECLLGREAVDFLQRTISRDGATIRIERYGIDPDGVSRVKLFVDSRDLSTLLIDQGFARPATGSPAANWCAGQ
jgi:endonuclease YncB( thermonuclease family)